MRSDGARARTVLGQADGDLALAAGWRGRRGSVVSCPPFPGQDHPEMPDNGNEVLLRKSGGGSVPDADRG